MVRQARGYHRQLQTCGWRLTRWTRSRYNVSEGMTFRLIQMTERKLVRVQEKGQVTLPTDIRKRLGLKKGDLVAVVETEDGVLITPQEVLGAKALERVGQILRDQGLTLEDLIEPGREIRGQLAKDKYGIDPDTKSS